ncbi:hypothetical protein Dda_6323 [Drechslerella dactyloides]|uniref:Uncharacterized protein n=1 Tax=Drechslerella dactyloides TaxID=74499 RepID=A0AAD6NH71_DREDA|nr:hypothetical protein Dda_6323 [Drechslerella dactyloides]
MVKLQYELRTGGELGDGSVQQQQDGGAVPMSHPRASMLAPLSVALRPGTIGRQGEMGGLSLARAQPCRMRELTSHPVAMKPRANRGVGEEQVGIVSPVEQFRRLLGFWGRWPSAAHLIPSAAQIQLYGLEHLQLPGPHFASCFDQTAFRMCDQIETFDELRLPYGGRRHPLLI